MQWKNSLVIVVSLLITLGLLVTMGVEAVIEQIVQTPLWALVLVLLLYIVAIGLNGLAVWRLVRLFGNVSFGQFFRFFIASWSVGSIFPGRMGDFSLVFFHDALGVRQNAIAASVFLDKIMTLVMIILIGTVFWFLAADTLIEVATLLIVAAVVVGVLVGLAFQQNFLQYLGRWIPSFQRPLVAWKETVGIFRAGWKGVSINFGITAVRLAVQGASFWILLLALGFSVPLFTTIALLSLATLSIFVPFTFNGTGVKESLLVVLFGWAGVSASEATAAALVQLGLTYLLVIVVALGFGKQWLTTIRESTRR